MNFTKHISANIGIIRAWACAFAFLGALNPVPAGNLIIEIQGAESKGKIHLALCDSEANYKAVLEDEADPMKSAIIKPTADGTTHVFEKIPPGTYALMVFHDENSNGKFDKKLWPLEKYGFSNNVRVKFRAPKWKEVKFPMDKEDLELKVKLFKYSLL